MGNRDLEKVEQEVRSVGRGCCDGPVDRRRLHQVMFVLVLPHLVGLCYFTGSEEMALSSRGWLQFPLVLLSF